MSGWPQPHFQVAPAKVDWRGVPEIADDPHDTLKTQDMGDEVDKQGSRDVIKARIERGQYSSAAKMAELHVDVDPDDGQGWLCLADALEGMGRHSEARRALRIASVTCPRRSRHLLAFRRGHIQKNSCRWGSARRWYELAIHLDPSEAMALTLLELGSLGPSASI
jgi:tetratricopeptide (TPR) repeat protein